MSPALANDSRTRRERLLGGRSSPLRGKRGRSGNWRDPVVAARSGENPFTIICGACSSCIAYGWFFGFTSYALASRLRASCMEARVAKVATVRRGSRNPWRAAGFVRTRRRCALDHPVARGSRISDGQAGKHFAVPRPPGNRGNWGMTPATVRMPWTTVSSVSAGPCDLVVGGKADPRGPASNGAGDRSRSSLRAGIRLGRDLLLPASSRRPERASGHAPSEGYRLRTPRSGVRWR